jgi:hypothetical protein
MVAVFALLAMLAVAEPAWAQFWWTPVNPALAQAQAMALIQPKHPLDDPALPKQFGNAEGTGVNAPVPGSGRTPKFFGMAPDFDGVNPPPAGTGAPAGGAPPTPRP